MLDLNTATSHFTQEKELKEVHARKCDNYFNIITDNAKSIGMKIIAEKTQLLCFNDCNYSKTKSFIYTSPTEKITSGPEMKILGFIFNEKPTVKAHIDYSIKKTNRVMWALSHLRKAGLPDVVLTNVYCSMLRSIIEFCNVVYHSMLTEEMNLEIERVQKMALKIIYGFNLSYEKLLKKSGLSTLKTRRESAFLKFANTLANNQRYTDWFPTADQLNYSLRTNKKYSEFYARTNRLYTSPLYTMRRVLNTGNEDNEETTEI